MNALMIEPDVIADEICCLNWRMPDGTRRQCDRAGIWEIQRNGEPLAFTCDQHLQGVLGMVYSYEPDETMFLCVVPMHNLNVEATQPIYSSACLRPPIYASACLRPVPIQCGGLLERGQITRVDHFPEPRPARDGASWST